MNIESLRDYVLQKPFVTEGFPFGDTVIVFKVKEKVFLLVPLDTIPLQFNVKCEPSLAIELREDYPDSVLPGYHMNKKHWNTVIVDGKLSNKQLIEMVDESYRLVAKIK
ncbi:MAG: MmcQ/YjbR family DNA-binding protein [Sphingobacteriales bacterium]|nr:MmcQ/YjbR family DNA-binding protein [Sphingobacteriales bacterium]